MMYSLTHGACSSFENDISKCETVLLEKADCEYESHSSEHNTKSEQSSFHSCSCVNIFFNNSQHLTLVFIESSIFSLSSVSHYQKKFFNRIDKPPISLI